MRQEINGQQYEIRIQTRIVTTADIMQHGKVVATGKAVLAPEDVKNMTFTKEEGWKIAAGRALEDIRYSTGSPAVIGKNYEQVLRNIVSKKKSQVARKEYEEIRTRENEKINMKSPFGKQEYYSPIFDPIHKAKDIAYGMNKDWSPSSLNALASKYSFPNHPIYPAKDIPSGIDAFNRARRAAKNSYPEPMNYVQQQAVIDTILDQINRLKDDGKF